MNNYNPSDLIASDDNSIHDQIQQSKQYAQQLQDKASEQLKQTGEMIGNEVLRSGFEKLGSSFSKATGITSMAGLSDNINKLGFQKGIALTLANSKKEGTQKLLDLSDNKIQSFKTQAKSIQSNLEIFSSSNVLPLP